ncbi:MAG: hypothetical protein KDB35_15025 [Acidimicrobiales bacterium]|nr:hypothetical protein [Acidimicrobiales bacterium]MCB1015355.1 hypothetical protein [Acidimicrobiales bacterium]MCB9372801.1 hypothetical protein [Microthrixaceae bacterium]
MRALRTPVLAAGLALALLLGACGSADDDVASTGSGDDATTSAPTVQSIPGTATGDVTWTRIEPTQDLVGAVIAEPSELLVDPDDDATVLVRFYGGVQDCYGAHATVEESDDAVVVTLETGTRPDAVDRACIEIAEAQELAVSLDAPLGDRSLSATPAG